MTVLNHLPPIHLHPILIAFIFIALLTGTFVELFIILCIVLWHELGHYTTAKLFNWRIRNIVLWIFGGVMDTDEHGNRPIYEELLVTVSGPFQHVLIYFFVQLLAVFQLLPASIIEVILFYNMVILIFNLLPIWPLDGGKLLFLSLSLVMPYKKSHYTVILFSMILSILLFFVQLFFISFSLSTFLLLIFLFMENRSEWKQRYYVFMRFLLQRYEGNTSINGVKSIVVPHQLPLMDVFAQFQRDKKHAIYVTLPGKKRLVVDENDCLRSYFYEKQVGKTVGDVAMQIT